MKIKYLPILFTLFFAKFSFAASDSSKPMQYNFSFNGIFGSLDKKSHKEDYKFIQKFVPLAMD